MIFHQKMKKTLISHFDLTYQLPLKIILTPIAKFSSHLFSFVQQNFFPVRKMLGMRKQSN